MLHGIHCIQSCCIKSTAFNRVPFLHAAWITLHSITLHGIYCIQLVSITQCCMDSTAFNHAAWNPLNSIGMHFTRLHGLHCIQLQSMVSTASMTMHGIHCLQSGCFWPWCIKSTAFNLAEWYPLHSIGMLWAMLQNIHCIQSCCRKTRHSIMLHKRHFIQ